MLPITKMLEKLLEDNCFENVDDRECSKELIETIRHMETSLIEKAKEEERQRIVGIIEEMIKEINGEKDGYYDTKKDRINLLVELIERLEKLPQKPNTYKYSITKEIIEEWQSNTDISKWEMHTFWNFINNKTK